MTSSIHEELKQARIESGLSIQILSKLSGISPSHISRIESGTRNPSFQTLKALAPHIERRYIDLLAIADLFHPTDGKYHLEEILSGDIYFEDQLISSDTKQTILSFLSKH